MHAETGKEKDKEVLTDGKQGPGDRGGSGGITFFGSESVGSCGSLQKDESQEDKDFGPDTGFVGGGIYTEGLEKGENDQYDSPWRSVSADSSLLLGVRRTM